MILRYTFLLVLLNKITWAFECFRNTADFGYEVQYCNSRQFPFCLKADSYDGKIYRNCASIEQCPQGIGCAPITYDEDGTTDYVCCCATPLCNSAPRYLPFMYIILAFILFKFLVR